MPSFDGAGTEKLLKEAKQAGVLCCLDTAWDSTGQWMKKIEGSLPYLDWFMPSFDEARELSGKTAPSEMADLFLAKGVRNVIIKIGKDGCFVKPGNEKGFRTITIIRGEEFEEFDNIKEIINEKNEKNADRYKKYIKKLNSIGIKVDFIYQSRPIDKVSATKFMEKLDEYKYNQTLNIVKKDDLYELMDFIPNEVKTKDKYKIIKKILSFNTYA